MICEIENDSVERNIDFYTGTTMSPPTFGESTNSQAVTQLQTFLWLESNHQHDADVEITDSSVESWSLVSMTSLCLFSRKITMCHPFIS